MKKKLLSIMMATMMLSLVACGQDTKSKSAGEPEVESSSLNTESVQEQQTSETNQENDSEITVDTEEIEDVVEDDSYDFGDMDPLYVSYLKNEISVENPYDILTYKEDYTSEFQDATIGYALVDVNGDGENELVVNLSGAVDQLLEILTISDDKLTVVDIFESHSMRMGASVYTNGVVGEDSTYDDMMDFYFSYDLSGQRKGIITFYKAADSESQLLYEYYYLDGNSDSKVMLSSDDEYQELRAKYVGQPVEYIDITDFVESL